MKFSRYAFLALSALSFASATEEAEQVPVDVPVEVEQNKKAFTPSKEKPFNFRIDYKIDGSENTELLSVFNGQTVAVHYNFTNGEEAEVTVAGVGGQLLDPVTGDVKANVTATNIGPLVIGEDGFADFIQNVGIDVEPADYVFVPAIYIMFNEKLMVLGSRNQLLHVEDEEISLFNPKFLVLAVVLLVTLAGAGYAGFELFGKKYLATYFAKRAAKEAATAGISEAIKASGADSSWLPETHLQNAKKSKKAN